MITISEEIAVPSPPERVWDVVSDPAEVVSCISGAELGRTHDDGSFDATLTVKFGAVRVKFGALVSLELNAPDRDGRLLASGKDTQGASRFKADAGFGVTPDPSAGGSRVSVRGEVTLAGKLASLVESGAGAVVSRMTRDFSTELVRRCAGEQALAEVDQRGTAASVHRSWFTRVRAWWLRVLAVRRGRTRGGVL